MEEGVKELEGELNAVVKEVKSRPCLVNNLVWIHLSQAWQFDAARWVICRSFSIPICLMATED